MKDDKILKVSESVDWVGVLDPDIKTFDIVMETRNGTTYNSYVIRAEKPAVVEISKEKFWDDYIAKIKKSINPENIEYIIVNHTEPDHSGNLLNLIKVAPKAKVVGSGNAIRYLSDLFGFEFPNIVVKGGSKLDLGDKTLEFIGAPNLHWPDSIYTYLREEKILFTCDSFGAHYCSEEMYDDMVGNFDYAFTYYFNVILKPFSKYMLRAIEKIRQLEIATICTGHGPILRTNWKKYVDLSEEYARKYLAQPSCISVFIPYVSAYGKTALIAGKIAEGVKQAGNIDVVLMDIEKINICEVEDALVKSSGIIIGSPTINKNTLPQIYQIFTIASPIRDKNKLAAVFGSYGWSGEALKIIQDNLSNLRFKIFDDSFGVKFTLHERDYAKCIEYGKRFGQKLLENISEK